MLSQQFINNNPNIVIKWARKKKIITKSLYLEHENTQGNSKIEVTIPLLFTLPNWNSQRKVSSNNI
jgi:hypothetical protein